VEYEDISGHFLSIIYTMNNEELKRRFLEYIEIERGRSVKTVENYDRYLSRFLSFSSAKKPSDITEQSIREFRLWLNRQNVGVQASGKNSGATLKKRTQNYYLIALRAFLKFLQREGVETISPERIELAKLPERSLDLISSEELGRLLAAPQGSGATDLRDRAILELLFSTGLGVSELCNLDVDIDLSRDELSVRGKGDKVRVVFLSPSAKEAVLAYIKARKDFAEPLFVGNGRGGSAGSRITPRSVQRLIKHYAVKAGITRKVTPHVIRHSFATDLLSNGADLRSVQALLGHANIGTTQIYTHVTDAHLHDVHRRFHGKRRT
jgi:site-specific recombinase XerD